MEGAGGMGRQGEAGRGVGGEELAGKADGKEGERERKRAQSKEILGNLKPE